MIINTKTMKKLSFLVLLLCMTISFGQNRAVSQKIQELTMAKRQFSNFELFTKSNDASKSTKYLHSATDVTVLNLNSSELNRIATEAPELLTLNVPYLNKNIEVVLYKQTPVADSFFATDESGNQINYTPGEYYRGIVNGDFNSLVAISFFNDDVIGVISTEEDGNINLGKSADQADYVTYSDTNILGDNPFNCGVDELVHNQEIMDQINFDPTMVPLQPETNNCVKIYYEIAYRPFQLRGKNIESTLDWITGIQNNISTLYANDDVNLSISQVRIWTYQDPYNGTHNENLDQFRQTVSDFNADLAHLVNNPTTTSVAYLNSLCTNYNYAYSGIAMTYSQVPTYSWTIMAMTHEMGHAFGSPHTHACAWNGNNTAIDGCGPAAGAGEGCNGPIPAEGGTLMSYCHLVSAGINFNLGFGPQPSQLIRNTIDSKTCVSTDCATTADVCTYAIKNLFITPLSSSEFKIEIQDDSSSSWKYQMVPFGSGMDENNWVSASGKIFTVNGPEENKYYDVFVTNICQDGTRGSIKKALILTGNFCDGTLFTDTGGITGTYSTNQNLVKTFYPSSSNGKVTINFSKIGLQTNSDFMYVYNGDSTNSPLFENGTITGSNNPGPSFTSTDASGAITIKFISDGSGNTYGWEGTVDCDAMGLSEVADADGISVYPNPSSDVINISSQKLEIKSAKLTDASGRVVITYEGNNQKSTKFVISHLPKGVYMLNLKLNGKTVTKKILKK